MNQSLLFPVESSQSSYVLKIKNKICLLLLVGIYFIFCENLEITLSDLPNVKNEINPNIKKLKYGLYNKIHVHTGLISNKIDTVFLTKGLQFGNSLIELNKAIFYCGFLECKRIILAEKMWYIKKELVINGIKIEPYRKVKCNKPKEILCLRHGFFYFFYGPPSPQPLSYYNLLQDEIYNNLDHLKSDPNELYIHIRSGDIFLNKKYIQYYQPPLCFYQKIINENKFKKIYILSSGFENPTVKKLLELYPNIIFQNNTVIHDINVLSHAVNIVTSTSSFCWSIINYSKNIKNVWNYDLLGKDHRPVWLLTDENIKKKIYTEYVMKPKDDYFNKINPFYASDEQLKLMIEYQCEDDEFIKIEPTS